jgi:hypothetical protein
MNRSITSGRVAGGGWKDNLPVVVTFGFSQQKMASHKANKLIEEIVAFLLLLLLSLPWSLPLPLARDWSEVSKIEAPGLTIVDEEMCIKAGSHCKWKCANLLY